MEEYIRAGNDSHWTEMPVGIDELSQEEFDAEQERY